MLKRILILLIGDIILIGSWLLWEKPDPSLSIAGVIIVPALVILNVIFGIVLLMFKKTKASNAFFTNGLLSAIAFSLLFNAWYEYRRWRTYEIFTFQKGGNTFEIALNRNEVSFHISDITTKSERSTTGFMFGDYEVKNDTIILHDIGRRSKCYIYDDRIFKFQGEDQIFMLKKK